MNLQFVTSVSKGYWNSIGKYCISTWDLPGEVIVYIDQQEGDVEWFDEIPYKKRLLHVPALRSKIDDSEDESENDGIPVQSKTKVRKFWGKACAQIHAVKNRDANTRVIWIDADIEQLAEVPKPMFSWRFSDPVAMMKSNTWNPDCWETGLVMFNHQYTKLDLFIKHYESFWHDPELMASVYRPYDAIILGSAVEKYNKGRFFNLCKKPCENVNALENTIFKDKLKHWINKANKAKLMELKNEKR